MKNFPHQFNDLAKLFNALSIAKKLINDKTSLNDDNYGIQLTRENIYTYRDKTLSIAEYLEKEQEKPASNRGYLTVARDIRRLFELLGFLTVFPDKTAKLSPSANQLLKTESSAARKELWRNALLQLGLEGTDGEVSHPYRILLKLVNNFPEIETPKLLLALEAENDSDEEFERISNLAQRDIEQIISEIGTTNSMAANAVKILPGIAEQLGDIERINNQAHPVGQIVITEDEITTEERAETSRTIRAAFRETSAREIAKAPNLKDISNISIDLAEAVKIRQKRLVEHQEIVRLLAKLNEDCGFQLFEGKFDCLATKNKNALLYEVKTILESPSDTEKQTVKGVGQLKFYKFSIVHKQMGYTNIKEIIVFSRQPAKEIIEFCLSENIFLVWKESGNFKIFNQETMRSEMFNPIDLL